MTDYVDSKTRVEGGLKGAVHRKLGNFGVSVIYVLSVAFNLQG